MLKNRDESTELITNFIINEHKELHGTTIKYNRMTIFNYLFYECLSLLKNIKNYVKVQK